MGTHNRNSRVFSAEYLALYPDKEKFCPACEETVPLTPDHWHVTKTGTARAYCRRCTNRLAVEYHRQRDRTQPPKRAICSVCGERRDVRTGSDGIAICRPCATVFVDYGQDIRIVVSRLKEVREHNQEVEERRERHNSNKVFLPHPTWMGQYPSGDHRNCIKLERSLRGAVTLLAKLPKESQTRESRDEDEAVVLAEWKEGAR